MYVSFSTNLLYHEKVSQTFKERIRGFVLKKIKLLLMGLTILTCLFFAYFVTYTFVEPKAYDFMISHVLTEKVPFDKNKQTYGSDDVVLVVIDKKTIEKYRWPWRRDLYCKIYEYFKKYAKPDVILHDTLIASLDIENPDADSKFFASIDKMDNLVMGFMPNVVGWENTDFGKKYDEMFTKYAVNSINKITLPSYGYWSFLPFPKPYFDVVKHCGSVSMIPGFIDGNVSSYAMDEIIRNHEYIIRYQDKIYPSVAMEGFLIKNNNPQMVVSNSHIYFPELNYKIKQKSTIYQSFVPLRFYKLNDQGYTHKKYSAVDILDSYDAITSGKKPIINPEIFKNKIVIFGANVPAGSGLNDNKNTPIISHHPGVDIQATATDNILHNDFLKIVPKFLNILLMILGMTLIYILIRVNDLFKSIALSIGLIGGYFLFAAMCYYFKIVTFVITPPVMFVITMLIGYTHKFVLENRSKEKVKFAMGKYMSQDVMKRVIMNIDNLGLGGKKATVTVLFSDIRGFTSMSEQMSAQQVSEILNEYFTEMEPIITKYNGIINKFIGDAVMAIFGEPIQDKEHASNAVKCGYEMLLKVKELQKKWATEGKPKIDIGIGINTGEVFVGNIGSINRMEYTVIGDTVNLASRLESYNKVYKTKMLISSSTYEATKSFIDVIKISDVEIRGKSHKMNIYEVLKVNE